MTDQRPNRYIPVNADAFVHRLPKVVEAMAGGGPVKIVAIGSSSTEGEGNIVPYPFRLQTMLRNRNPGRSISVLNRGKGGEEASQELARMQVDVIDQQPALAIWQVGTNAVWQPGHKLDDVAAAIAEGLNLLAAAHIDVVLMDPQYVPAVLTDDKIDATRRMLSLIAKAAATAKVNVFRRFAMMQKWHEVEKYSFDTMVDQTDMDRLHQSDWSTQRVAFELCEVIAAAAAPKA